MSLNKGTTASNKFINGWITDATGLNFPEEAATDCDNVEFDADGRVYRRKGFDVDEGGATIGGGADVTHATSVTTWRKVDELATKAFLVQQAGDTLYVFDISTTNTPTGAPIFTYTIPAVAGSTLNPRDFKCGYSMLEGSLVVANGAADTFYIDYDSAIGTFSTNLVDLKVRDFTGLDLPDVEDVRPTTDYATLRTARPDYLYNLFNNGWTHDALTQWDAARTDMPALSEFIGEYSDDNGDFKAANVKDDVGHASNFGGHYVVDAFNPDRQTLLALSASGTQATSTVHVITDTLSAIDPNMYGGVSDPTWGKPSQADIDINIVATSRVEVRGSDTEPTAYNQGTLIGAINTGVAASVTVPTAGSEAYAYYWVYSYELATPVNVTVATALSVTTVDQVAAGGVGVLVDPDVSTFARPQFTITYNNRVIYGGVADDKRGTNIYISRTVEKQKDFNKTYQKNDPTDAYNSQLLANDGLVVKVSDMVGLQGFSVMGNDLIILASNGVWAITGSSGNAFSTKDFGLRKLSCTPCISGCSVVDANDAPVWWTGSEIVTLQYNVQFHSYQIKSLSVKRINNYLRDLPDRYQRHVCGAHDCGARKIYWLYNDGTDEDLTEDKYNRVLVLNIDTQAFYRWSGSPQVNHYVSQPFVVHPGDRSVDGVIKYAVTDEVNGTLQYGSFRDEVHEDWRSITTERHVYFNSFFDTGYAVHGEGSRKTQFGYVHIFLDQEDVYGAARPSIYVQGRFSWAASGSTGKWSKKMQGYRPRRFKHSVARARLRVRGQGEAMQLHMESYEAHPFSVIGWTSEELVPSKG